MLGRVDLFNAVMLESKAAAIVWFSCNDSVNLQVAYAMASFEFFKDRVEYEEEQLIKFFGPDYIQYQKDVPVGMLLVCRTLRLSL